MISALAKSFSRDEASAPEAFNAPLFTSLVERVPEDRRFVVLDLGAVCPEVISLFGGHRCRVDVADISAGLAELNAQDEEPARRQAAESLLPELHAEAADAVLCWDMPNYLGREALSTLMARVADRARPGTLVHALICYSDPKMPVVPGHYRPGEDGSLTNVAMNGEYCDAPRYTPEDLTLCMKGLYHRSRHVTEQRHAGVFVPALMLA